MQIRHSYAGSAAKANTEDKVKERPETELYQHEAAAAIRRLEAGKNRHTPIIAVTAGATSEEKEMSLCAGMDDYIKKPVLLDALSGTLARWLPGAVKNGRQVLGGAFAETAASRDILPSFVPEEKRRSCCKRWARTRRFCPGCWPPSLGICRKSLPRWKPP